MKYGKKKYSHQFSLTIESNSKDGFRSKRRLKKLINHIQHISLEEMWDNETGVHYWYPIDDKKPYKNNTIRFLSTFPCHGQLMQ